MVDQIGLASIHFLACKIVYPTTHLNQRVLRKAKLALLHGIEAQHMVTLVSSWIQLGWRVEQIQLNCQKITMIFLMRVCKDRRAEKMVELWVAWDKSTLPNRKAQSAKQSHKDKTKATLMAQLLRYVRRTWDKLSSYPKPVWLTKWLECKKTDRSSSWDLRMDPTRVNWSRRSSVRLKSFENW